MPSDSIAVIDGALCRLNRFGDQAARHYPLAHSVAEFRQGPMCIYVREHPFGLLPGIPNLYCLDGDFRLQWIAEWPDGNDMCARILDEKGDTLVVESTAGLVVHLNAHTGVLAGIHEPMAATG